MMGGTMMMEQTRQTMTFEAALARLGRQVDLGDLIAGAPERTGIYRELVRIAADVYTRSWGRPVVVDGEEVTFGYLQEIFKLLTGEHLEYTADVLEKYPREIRNKKAFLRTVMCQSVFEFHSDIENRYARRYSNQ